MKYRLTRPDGSRRYSEYLEDLATEMGSKITESYWSSYELNGYVVQDLSRSDDGE